MTTVQEMINELLKFPKDKKVYTNKIRENLRGEIVLMHEDTCEEKRKREEEIERINRKWEEEMEHDRDMPTFASRW